MSNWAEGSRDKLLFLLGYRVYDINIFYDYGLFF